jgi:lipopolysaccharide/colanic/teichoic acid biosynthesis glycosyltransferase
VLDIFDKPIADWNMVMKTLFDRVAGLLILAALSPVMLAAAIAVKLDSPGSVLFRQRRLGFNNEVIQIFKFRSLYHEHADPNARRIVTKGDSRVTRVGRFIRKTSIDELPQLFNVRWSVRAPTPSRHRPRTGCGRKWSTVISPATACAPA